MALCSLSTELNTNSYTVVDNAFIYEYMPQSPNFSTQIYLFGLSLASSGNKDINSVDQMCKILGVTEQDVLDAYTYWEEIGIVHILRKNPLEVQYLQQSSTRNLLKKVKAGKYKSFNKQMQEVLSDRMISVNEYNEYYVFMESTFFDPDALVMVAKYCADIRGKDVNYNYILKVARDWDKAGLKTAEKVKEKIDNQVNCSDDLKKLFATMGIRKDVDIEDRQMFYKWTEDFNFTPEVILELGNGFKKQSLHKFDSALEEYYKLNLLSVKEIQSYNQQKEEHYNLAKEVNRNLGLYYSNMAMEVEEYVVPWLSLGYSAETITVLAKFCFKCRIQTLEGMDQKIRLLQSKGLVGLDSISSYTENVLRADQQIARLLDTLGVVRNVCSADRKNYKNWTENWGFDDELLQFAGEKSSDAFNPMAYLNKLLADFKANGVTNVTKAKEYLSKQSVGTTKTETSTKPNKFLDMPSREYTAEQLNAMFDNLQDSEN